MRTQLSAWWRTHLGLIGYLILTFGIVLSLWFLNETRLGLCSLRADFDSRIVQQENSILRARVFLMEHPNGAFGFTRADIQTQIDAQVRTLVNSRRTRRALDVVPCGSGVWPY